MKSEIFRFDEVTENYDRMRVPLSSIQRKNRGGKYRYYGAQGVIDYVDDYIFDGEYLLIAEDGENLKSHKQNIAQLVKGKFWVNNHAHILRNNSKCDLHYLYYLINSMDLSGYITGSAQPKLSQTNMNAIPLAIPQINDQRKIISIIGALDDKIYLNNEINKNLEQQVSSLYQAQFEDIIQYDGICPSSWKKGILSDIASLASGKRPPMKSSEKTDISKTPIVGAASVMGFTSEPNHINKILVTGRVGTHGVIQRFNSPCWTSDNTLVITSDFYEYTYQILQRIDYHAMNRGSTQPLITQGDMNKVSVLLPDKETLQQYENTAGQLMAMYDANLLENTKLAELRDSLLPQLMSGELDVSDIDI